MGPHAAYDEWMEKEFNLKRCKDNETICPAVCVHNDEVCLDSYKHLIKGFDENIQHVDAMRFSFNYNMRFYCDVRLM